MRIEIPEFKRCLCCLPLRRGIIIFGYLNLAFAAINISFDICLVVFECNMKPVTTTIYKGSIFYIQTWVPVLLYSMEFILNMVLLIGAHMKIPLLLRIFYYYGVSTLLATVLSMILTRYYLPDFSELGFAFCGFVITGYLLLLVRTELKKLKQEQQNYLMTELPPNCSVIP